MPVRLLRFIPNKIQIQIYLDMKKEHIIQPLMKSARVKKCADIDQYFNLRDKKAKYLKYLIVHEDRVDLLAELAGLRYDPIHDALIDFQLNSIYTLQLAFRGCGKTTVGTILKTAHKIIKNRNHRHLIASESASLAWDMLSAIKSILTCEAVVEVFGDLKGNVWHESAINIAGRSIHSKEKTISTCGADGAITGGHFDEIDVDDIVTFRNSRTYSSRQKIKDWFRITLLPMVTDASTPIHVKGTPYHPFDLYNDLRKFDPKFRNSCQVIPAFIPGSFESNYPERFSASFFESQRESMGSPLFNAQFEMNAAGIQGDIFDSDHFRYYKGLPQNLYVYMGVDLAIGRDNRHDMFALVVIGINPKTKDIYVLDYRKTKLTLVGQNNIILAKTNTWNPILVGIEANAFQAAKIQELRSNKRFAHIPAIKIYSDVDKITEAQRIAARYERGEIWHAEHERDGELEADLLAFPDGQYKDLPDALSIAIRTVFRRKHRKRSNRKEKIGIIGGKKHGFNSRNKNVGRHSRRYWGSY